METQLPGGLKLRMNRLQAILKYNMKEDNFRKKLLSSFPKEVIQENRKTEIKALIIRDNPSFTNENAEDGLKKTSCKEISEITKIESRENTENFLLQAIKETYKQISNAGITNVYLSPGIPQKKSDNVMEKYCKLLNPKEQILLVYDGTLFGSAKEGFILTNCGVGWCELRGSPKYCRYEDIQLENVQKTSSNDLVFVKSLPGAALYANQGDLILPNLVDLFKKIKGDENSYSKASFTNENAEDGLKKTSCKEISEITKIESRENTENFLLQAIKETYKQISNAGITNVYLSPDIPQKKSDNVMEKYCKLLNPKEQILLVYDGTLFGSAKDGFMLTNCGIGWSETWGSPKYCVYENIVLNNIMKISENELKFASALRGAYINSGHIDNILPIIIEFIKKVQEIKCI